MKCIRLKSRLSLLFFLVVVFILPRNSLSFRDIPDDNLAYPVLLISTEGTQANANTGSGFFYNKEDATYFITARHVLFQGTSVHDLEEQFPLPNFLAHKFEWNHDDQKKKWTLVFYGQMSEKERDELLNAAPSFKDAIQLLYRESQNLKLIKTTAILYSYSPKPGDTAVNEVQLELPKLYRAGKIIYHPSSDVASITIATPKKIGDQNFLEPIDGVTIKGPGTLGLEKNNFKLFDDVLVGNTVYTFGYPTSLSNASPFIDIKLPLLRKGIIAGKNNSLKVIILDSPIFYGNSGGLVIEAERSDNFKTAFKAIGLVTNFVPYAQKWLQNSGYSVAVPMDFVEELLKSIPKN